MLILQSIIDMIPSPNYNAGMSDINMKMFSGNHTYFLVDDGLDGLSVDKNTLVIDGTERKY